MKKKPNRLQELTKYCDKEALGIEVAPYFNPAVPKSQGYNVRILDLHPTEDLRTRAIASQHIPDNRASEIEEVDITGDASSIAELVQGAGIKGDVRYIVSSHNFEHLPNPVKFLQGCAEVMAEGGVLSMAIPDYRCCFDHFRFPTRLSDWLRAYREGHSRPSADVIFDADQAKAKYHCNGEVQQSGAIENAAPTDFVALQQMPEAFGEYQLHLKGADKYRDVHCTVVFGAIFELMVRDLAFLGMLGLEVIDVTETRGHEFFAHLRKTSSGPPAAEAYYATRERLLRDIDKGLGPLAFPKVRQGVVGGYFEPSLSAILSSRNVYEKLLGEARVSKLRKWNRDRKDRRRQRRAESSK